MGHTSKVQPSRMSKSLSLTLILAVVVGAFLMWSPSPTYAHGESIQVTAFWKQSQVIR